MMIDTGRRLLGRLPVRVPPRWSAASWRPGVLIAFIGLLVACVSASAGPAGGRSVGPSRHGLAVADDRSGSPAPGRAGGEPAPAADPSQVDDADAALLQPYLGRIPHFPPPPPPERITLPAGPQAAWLGRIPTQQPVAFITIDDGWIKQPIGPALLRAAHVPVTLFLAINAIQGDPEYFRPLQAAGAVIEAHTLTHPNLKGRSYDAQRREICGSADRLGEWYGRRPVLFRPPFGDKDQTTLRAAGDCGIRAAFIWSETVDRGIVRYQVGNRIQPGDIILMHFRPAFAEDFLAALAAIHDAGLTPALLEDYVT